MGSWDGGSLVFGVQIKDAKHLIWVGGVATFSGARSLSMGRGVSLDGVRRLS